MTNEMVLEYEPYIYGIAKKFENYKNKEDLIQVGFMGLVMALRNYKKDRDSKFTTYAYKYIYGEMCKLVREDKEIKVSRNIVKLKNNIEKARCILSQKLGRDPTNIELATFLEINIDELEEVLKINTSVQSIDKPINSDGKEINLYDVIESKEMDINTLIALKDSLSKLDQTSRKILTYSMNMTEKEVGQHFNMSQVQVSRTLKKIKQNIRENM